jgi:hypothetical protein
MAHQTRAGVTFSMAALGRWSTRADLMVVFPSDGRGTGAVADGERAAQHTSGTLMPPQDFPCVPASETARDRTSYSSPESWPR